MKQPVKLLFPPEELVLCLKICNSRCETHLKRRKRALPACSNTSNLPKKVIFWKGAVPGRSPGSNQASKGNQLCCLWKGRKKTPRGKWNGDNFQVLGTEPCDWAQSRVARKAWENAEALGTLAPRASERAGAAQRRVPLPGGSASLPQPRPAPRPRCRNSPGCTRASNPSAWLES